MTPELARRKARRLHPQLDQILDQTFPQFQLHHFREPALRDVQHRERAGDDAKDTELLHELAQVAVRQRVVKRLIPAVQPDLRIGGRRNDDEHASAQREQPVAQRGGPQRADHHAQLQYQSGVRAVDFIRANGHHDAYP
jgi:hypothetical protein